ncbi:transposase [Dyadobacter sp. CY356]|uniref:transposase n=1 Tax=Dyadobacter sp. CY356 TaxID=2906442 RepID=UPI001F207EAD|nr:transposase [Dyadobacter sp. CY356]MCF0059852.1 transposase [Dyadobacter sp. CY356]
MSNSKSNSKKSTKLNIRPRRIFSEQFKREKVGQILAGEVSILSLSKLWDVSLNSIYKWVYKYSPDHKKGTTMVIQKDSEATKLNELQQKIAELERAIGQKQMVIDYQDKLIEIASKELEIDLKKSFNPGP